MAITKTKNAIFGDDFVNSLEDLNLFFGKNRKIIKRSSEIAILVKNMEFSILEDLLVILFGEMGKNSCGFIRKIYRKILEKREMSFRSLKNKNWTFRGSFDKFSAFFRYFLGNFYPKMNEYFSQHVWEKRDKN